MKIFLFALLSITVSTSCSKSLMFQRRAVKNQIELEAIAREVQEYRTVRHPNYPYGGFYWSTRHIKVFTDTNNYHFEIINHKDFRDGDHCDSLDTTLPLSPEQNKFLINKFKIMEIKSSLKLECRDTYVYGDSTVIFINHGKLAFCGMGKDHILFIDLRMAPRQVLLQEQAKKCYFTCKYDKAYKISNRIFYVIEKHEAFWGS
ncbi:MAG: hypothetical protein K9I37_10160 [Crocinitomicaceae bacterium]|nr:hypothetical protein [Crocinitomicaceae bacterium]